MARKRCLPTKLFFDPDFMRLSSDTVRLIWIGLVLDADDSGRGEAYPTILGRKFGQASSDVEQALQELETRGLLHCYEVEGRRYYWLPDWNKLQTLSKPTPSEFPPAPADTTTPQNPQRNSGDVRKTSLEGEEEEEKEKESVLEDEGTTPLTGERAQAILRGRPHGRLGRVGSGNACLRGRPRGRFGAVGSDTVALRGRPRRFGSTQGAGATLKRSNSETLQM